MGGKRIFDFQGYNSDDGSFIIKEITIVDIHENEILHYLVSPPFDASFLSEKELKRVQWLEKFHHRINWDEKGIEYSQLFSIIREAVKNADVLYVKGSERTTFLRKITGKLVIDLDHLDCPKASCLPDISKNFTCPHTTHWYGDNQSGVCSLVQALKFKTWLKELFDKSEDELDFV